MYTVQASLTKMWRKPPRYIGVYTVAPPVLVLCSLVKQTPIADTLRYSLICALVSNYMISTDNF
jgi:hypothetical protein